MVDIDSKGKIRIDPLIQVSTVMEILQVSEGTVRKMIRSGKLEGIKIESCTRITRSSLLGYLETNKIPIESFNIDS